MRNTMLAAFAVTGLLAASPAGAAPTLALPLASADQPAVTLVSGGCGPAFHRGPYGGCRPNFYGRGYGYGRPFYRGYHRPYGFYR